MLATPVPGERLRPKLRAAMSATLAGRDGTMAKRLRADYCDDRPTVSLLLAQGLRERGTAGRPTEAGYTRRLRVGLAILLGTYPGGVGRHARTRRKSFRKRDTHSPYVGPIRTQTTLRRLSHTRRDTVRKASETTGITTGERSGRKMGFPANGNTVVIEYSSIATRHRQTVRRGLPTGELRQWVQ